MLFEEINEKNKKKIKYLVSKFGVGTYYGPVFEVIKGKKIKINGNFNSNYDLTSYFLSLDEEVKIKKGKFFVPKDLEYNTTFEIIKEKKGKIYNEIEVKGNGIFNADYFIFIGEIENKFGKLKAKKKDSQNEEDKNFLKSIEISLKKDTFFPFDFKEKLSYKILIKIKKIDLKGIENLPAEEKRMKAKREMEIEKTINIDGEKREEKLLLTL